MMSSVASVFRPADLGLRPGAGERQPAAEAIRDEHRRACRWVKLRCVGHEPVGDSKNGIHRLDLGGMANVDWTWEGAKAFRPIDIDDVESNGRVWSGEVVEFDQDAGALYVVIEGQPPTTGTFYVAPFDFIGALRQVFERQECRPLWATLDRCLRAAREGGPGDNANSSTGMPELTGAWGRSWGAIWGPPGTGKTYTIGEQVARAVPGSNERVLVVSTTNKATDLAALSIGRALRAQGSSLEGVVRIGSGAKWSRYAKKGMQELLAGTEIELRRQLSELKTRYDATTLPPERALLNAQMQQIRKAIANAGGLFTAPDRQVVVSTAFGAMAALLSKDCMEQRLVGYAPFSTVIIDEASLISCAATAALALLAANRVLLVGDPKQLAPITRMSRILSPDEARLLATSGLGFLSEGKRSFPNVHMLTTQYRMSPQIREVVSRFQYGGALRDAPAVVGRPVPLDAPISTAPRAIWYVLDEDPGDSFAHIRADRGPGNRSWIRKRSLGVLEKIFRVHPQMKQADGLYLSPFKAQAKAVREFLVAEGASGWAASTVHAQQGAEATYVVFDTVNAGSTAWPFHEWQRLLNVGISRACEVVILLASRLEMQEPYMAPLAGLMSPLVLRGTGGRWRWEQVPASSAHTLSRLRRENEQTLGAQIEARKIMRPVLSAEQQRLCGYKIDGKPRLVRGVAGSGKTLVLANWLVQMLTDSTIRGKLWVVYANKALRGLIEEMIDQAWRQANPLLPLPRQRFDMLHIMDLLGVLQRELRINTRDLDRYDYNGIADRILDQVHRSSIRPRCAAMFIDEAQDFGPRTLELMFALVEPHDDDEQQRPAMVFYDNAQNVYGRGTPTWSELGLKMVGRSTVMKESFRSTRPITEFALNVLGQLRPLEKDEDHRELMKAGLVEQESREGKSWWNVKFNQVEGPQPIYKKFADRDAEVMALADQVRRWIKDEGVRPGDIKVLCNGSRYRRRVIAALERLLPSVHAQVLEQTSQAFAKQDDTVIASTAHSFKGYEGEVVAVPCADTFSVKKTDAVLDSALYVALTRARSILYVSCIQRHGSGPGSAIMRALDTSYDLLGSPPLGADETPTVDEELQGLLQLVGAEHGSWLGTLLSTYAVHREPIIRTDGSVIAEPVFWFQGPNYYHAFFGDQPIPRRVRHALEDAGVKILTVGALPTR